MSAEERSRGRGPGPGQWISILGGVLLVIAIFLPWYAVSSTSGAGQLTGLALSSRAPELGILPAIGLGAVLGGALLSRTPRGVRESLAPSTAAVVVGLAGIVVALEVGFRLGSTLQDWFGTSFYGSPGIGWYVAVLGGFLVLGAGLLRMVVPAQDGWPSEA